MYNIIVIVLIQWSMFLFVEEFSFVAKNETRNQTKAILMTESHMKEWIHTLGKGNVTFQVFPSTHKIIVFLHGTPGVKQIAQEDR